MYMSLEVMMSEITVTKRQKCDFTCMWYPENSNSKSGGKVELNGYRVSLVKIEKF